MQLRNLQNRQAMPEMKLHIRIRANTPIAGPAPETSAHAACDITHLTKPADSAEKTHSCAQKKSHRKPWGNLRILEGSEFRKIQ